ncbi:DUF4034 domain-containing protein [Candidatus Poribacteria bacterium]|nr:DUF4034 domain-containing protein [Candidatus Poribacteria bacterium]
MHRIILPISRLLVIGLIFALPACGAKETASILVNIKKRALEKNANSYRPPKRNSAGEALVTLKPPYTEWSWGKNGRVSVQNAVSAMCDQAGIGYDRKKSYENTDPICKKWTYPNYEDKPWKEALAETLTPVNLTYVVEDNTVVLMKIEDARRREQSIQGLRAEIAELLSAGAYRRELGDAVIVFPLLDSDGKTTAVGTLLCELGMLKAAYVPDKALNLHVPSVVELYHDMGYDGTRESPTEHERERILRRFETKDAATGALEIAGAGTFEINLHFDGSRGKRDFSTSGQKNDLHRVPQWIAHCIHEYRGTRLSRSQEEYVGLPELHDTAGLHTLTGLERDYWNGKKDVIEWTRFIKLNPDSVFALYHYCLVSRDTERDNSFRCITEHLEGSARNELVEFLEADWRHNAGKFEDSAPVFFNLLKGDYRNDALYERLDEGLLALGLGENAEGLHDLWEKHCPKSSNPLRSKGSFHINYAWNARGSGWASTVTEDRWEKFNERLHLAEQYLTRAYELDPTDPRTPSALVKVTLALGYERDQMEQWFSRAVEADPKYYPAYRNKLTYLMPKWHGSRGEMFEFARECAANAPEGSRAEFMLRLAHKEMAYRWGDETGKDWTHYYEDRKVWGELKSLYEKYLSKHPDSISDRNYFAETAFYAHDYEEAARQFDLIGKYIDTECWSEQYYYECRSEAYAKAKRNKS